MDQSKTVRELQAQILQEIDFDQELADEDVYRMVEEKTAVYARQKMLGLKERENLEKELFNALRKLDVIQELLEDDEITEVMVNGASCIFYEKGGKIYRDERQFSSK